MNYSSINIQGNIISSEILEKIRTEDIRFQKAIDFNLHPNTPVRDEINLAWSLALSHWKAFKIKRENLADTESGTAETRKYWILPLLGILGYEVNAANAEIINNKSYAISHRVSNKGGFPIHVVGVNQSLDKKAESGGTRLSPHALVQEYVNNTEHLYGLVCNGKFLRLLRDATRLSRLSYLEFNLELMMEEGLYIEFALLYRLLHSTRVPSHIDQGAESILEFYHQEAIASGTRIRERLSKAVEQSILALANGFLQSPENEFLREDIAANKLSPKNYYLYTLRLVYRMLFLLVIEERKLIYKEKLSTEEQKQRDIYYNFYSVQRLTKLAQKLVYVDAKKTDLWLSLKSTFALFEQGRYGHLLGIAPLGAGLFSEDALGLLKDQALNNDCLLKVIRYLVTFENENGQQVRVNYADLDVEEFGSVYEGLLEYDPAFNDATGQPIFSFVKGSARSSSGSHYTPEELVKPLIKHSLDYLIADKLKEKDPENALLSLSICDVACGSGHILLSAARRVGFELAKLRSNEEQPTPSVLRLAVRDVIKNCIYGVDKNPLAIELCKVALWLEAHNPGEPLNFLDHHIKCGDAIVGLAHREELENGIANEAFKAFTKEEKESLVPSDDARRLETTLASYLANVNKAERKIRENNALQIRADFDATTNANVQESMEEYKTFRTLPEKSPEQIEAKERAYNKFLGGKGYTFLKSMANAQIAQFFIPKTLANKDKLITDSEFRQILAGQKGWQGPKTAMALLEASNRNFFHWFIEFPEVFNEGGFDCILGNPPYLGGNKISRNYGVSFIEYLKVYHNVDGNSDLVVYFMKRAFNILSDNSAYAFIASQSIKERTSRIDGLLWILRNKGIINFAATDKDWPGKANTKVNLVAIGKEIKGLKKILNNKNVFNINSYLTDDAEDLSPLKLNSKFNQGFVGCFILGDGFILSKEEADDLIFKDNSSINVIGKYLIGDDFNDSPMQLSSRYAINFDNMSEIEASKYEACFEKILKKVKPEREKNTYSPRAKKYWWLYERNRPDLYHAIKDSQKYLITGKTSKHLSFVFNDFENNLILDQSLTILPINKFEQFAIIQSSIHNEWSRKFSTSQGGTPRYNASDTIQTFPFPKSLKEENRKLLAELGEQYHENRKELMLLINLGLTKTYNLFHAAILTSVDIEKQSKQDKTIAVKAFNDIVKLRDVHKQMDEAVLDAYGWNDIALRHDFYEVDYLPENDRVRYTIHPEARKEILNRLLALNHTIYEEEIKQGLHKEEDVKKFYEQKGIPVPADVIAILATGKKENKVKAYKKTKGKSNIVQETEAEYKAPELFGEEEI